MFLFFRRHTKPGDCMTDNQLFFSILARRAHIGQLRLRAILETSVHTQLRKLLLLQKKEYSTLEAHIHTLATSKGITLRNPDPLGLFISCRLLKLRISRCKSNAPIVSYVMHNCTQGMIDSLTVLNRCAPWNSSLRCTAQKLLDCERSCMIQLQDFL